MAFIILSHFTIGLISVLSLSPHTLWYEFLRKLEKKLRQTYFFLPISKNLYNYFIDAGTKHLCWELALKMAREMSDTNYPCDKSAIFG